eukprot:7302115-Alexandrium_andersonii.AAC.1
MEASWGPPNDTVQQLHLAQIPRTTAETPLDLTEELLLHGLLDDVQVRIVAGEGESSRLREPPSERRVLH